MRIRPLTAVLLIALMAPPIGLAQTQSGLRIIAHRGGAREFTENTVAAFQRALRLGADGIETDLRLTRDGSVVIYHDEKYGRVEGIPERERTREVADMTYAELAARPLQPVGEDGGGQTVPTLNDILREVRSGVLNLELKRGKRFDELVERTIEILADFPELHRVVLEPPDLQTAQKLREALGSTLKLHINPAYNEAVPFDVSLKEVLAFSPHSISISYKKLSWEIVDLAHQAGVEVWVWTVDDPRIARAAALLGVDAVKTDHPSLLLELK